MRRILIVLALIAAIITVSSCGDNSPKGSLNAALSALQSKDYKKMASYISDKQGNPLTEDQQHAIAAMIQEKGNKGQVSDLESYEIISEEIDESGNSAVVKYTITYAGKEPTEESQLMVKGSDGKWRMAIDK